MKPTQTFPPEVLLRAQDIQLLLLDVDGVLTDGGLYFGSEGEQLKRFHTLDGLGIKLLQQAGVTVAVVTGRDSPALRLRLKALGIVHAHFATEDKAPAAEQILAALNLNWSQAAAMGDDWPDVPVLRRCALALAPAHAHAEVCALAHHVTARAGGQGAVREACDLLLMAKGRYVNAWQEACR